MVIRSTLAVLASLALLSGCAGNDARTRPAASPADDALDWSGLETGDAEGSDSGTRDATGWDRLAQAAGNTDAPEPAAPPRPRAAPVRAAPPPASADRAYGGVGGMHWVDESYNGLVTLEDGSLWRVLDGGEIDSDLWLVTDDIEVLDGAGTYELLNTELGERVDAEYLGGD